MAVGKGLLFAVLIGCSLGSTGCQGANTEREITGIWDARSQEVKDAAAIGPKSKRAAIVVSSNEIRNVLGRIEALPLLSDEVLRGNPETIYEWFRRLEAWTENVITLNHTKEKVILDFAGRGIIIQELGRHYAEAEAQKIFKDFFYQEVEEGKSFFILRATEPHNGLRLLQGNLRVKLQDSSVIITGTAPQPGPIEHIYETFQLNRQNSQQGIKIDSVIRENQ